MRPRLHMLCLLVAVSWGRRHSPPNDNLTEEQQEERNINQNRSKQRLGSVRRCPKGMHVELDAGKYDRHAVNPRCGKKQPGGRCAEELEQHFILDDGIRPSQEFSEGRCSDLVRPKPWLDTPDDDFWDTDSPSTSGYLRGTLRFRCGVPAEIYALPRTTEFAFWKGMTLLVDDSDCRELLPFSTIFQHDTSKDSTEPLTWAARPIHGHPTEVASYTCGPPSPELFLKERVHSSYPNYNAALEACAALQNCAAVAENSRRQFKLLRDFDCSLAGKTSCGFDEGNKVLWRGTETSSLMGTVTKKWNCEEDKGWVSVRIGASDLFLPADGLERAYPTRVIGPRAWTVTQLVRPEITVKCGKLQEWHSCDINRRSDAIILFQNQTQTERDCRRACEARTASANILQSCCVLAGGICALTVGEHFAMDLDEYGASTETIFNKIPQEMEMASICRVTPCSQDPSCSLGSKAHFEAPPDIRIGPNEVGLYFDFAHPLSEAFRFNPSSTHVSVFHLTDLNKAAVEQARKDPSRLLRSVGSLPRNSPILETLTGKAGQQKLGLHLLWAPRPGHDKKDNNQIVERAQETLDQTCSAHSTKIGRKLQAPNLALALEHIIDGCQGLQRNTHSLDFESCLMRVGCAYADPEGGLLPFHGPWFSKLPFDIIAWQQPAPFCCAKPYVADQRSYELHKQFLQEVGFGDKLEDEINAISDHELRSSLQSSWRHGSMAMKNLLSSSGLDKDGLTWVASFTKRVGKAMGRFMKELKENADAEGDDDVEVAEDGESFLQVHQDGDKVAPSGRRAVEIARWSEDRGSFLQVHVHNQSLAGNIGHFAKRVPGAIYQYGLKPLWNRILVPLSKMGINAVKWCIEHPRAALFISKLALSLRNRMCEKASMFVYGQPEAETVGLFATISGEVSKAHEYLSSTFSPAVLLVGLQKSVLEDGFMEKIKGLGQAAFTTILAAIGLFGPIIGTLSSLLAAAATDAGKQAFEWMIYQEIVKEIPSNLFAMVTTRCLHPPRSLKLGLNATIGEVSGFAKRTVSAITDTIARKGRDLDDSLEKLGKLVGE